MCDFSCQNCVLCAFLWQDEEVAMLSEMGHLQEVVDVLDKHTADPLVLPPASEQVIADLKGSESSWTFQTPPSSPSSLGSRKSSMCSISSLNSSSSGSTKSHHSPSHHYWHRSLSQVRYLCFILSQDFWLGVISINMIVVQILIAVFFLLCYQTGKIQEPEPLEVI